MIKKTVKFEDFMGNEVEEDFYFNLTKAELLELETKDALIDEEGSISGGLSETLEKLTKSNRAGDIISMFQQILKWSYGVRSEDGRRFVKSEELWTEFTQSNAYSELLMLLAGDANEAASFVQGILPKGMPSDKPLTSTLTAGK